MTRSKYIVVLALALLSIPMVAAPVAARQDQPVLIDKLNVGSYGGGSNPQSNFNPYSFTALGGTADWLFEPLMLINTYTCEVVPWLATDFSGHLHQRPTGWDRSLHARQLQPLRVGLHPQSELLASGEDSGSGTGLHPE